MNLLLFAFVSYVLNLFQDTHEFDLHFDKVYKWYASNVQERQCFIIVLWKASRLVELRYFKQLKNI